MPRLLVDGEWFDSISPESIYESYFEELLIANSGVLYPGFHLARFKTVVVSEYGSGRPDLALIDKRFRCWWVIEVELSSHSMRGHVEKQVAIFSTARYGREEAHYISLQKPDLNAGALTAMMLGSQPRVLVVVDRSRPMWTETLARWNAIVGVAEIFKSRSEKIILRINGDHPEEPTDILSVCRVDPLLPTFLVVESPASLGSYPRESLPIWYQDSLTEWRLCDSAKREWLVPLRRYPLPQAIKSYVLLKSDDGRLILRPDAKIHLRGR